ncbi:bystin-like [Vigna radiata var. radiata]|uniref:Bystin n=1 Tax=Vigna radiata var. radiata TaxID=3916 RepID=A0A1S3VJY5_VIGRR|nr:bystin-like [Vigna radiata var. radiata]XP_014518424.1 bystin-like [Vigna radiata var. radiata]XP_022634355.1 bystin-like [Vigna radiata var. radiata]XP_022634356.1 bystin-like [Vigna radiata var. radiata]XP_022634357.1 bystin-like [Vigna radiata var. radiata]XP_022634358.1 bystin-like [Vigna radiata var. radiata]XP_022634359.1 bystin-like [Vigna radiata var. radiata]XP_022634360.1 bystin-like [Vigna radiata var. radiata]
MAKRKERIQNLEPFDPYGADRAKTKKRSKAPKQYQQEEKLIASKISSKIMKEALLQQKEEDEAVNDNAATFFEEIPKAEEVDGDDIDEFAGFSETQSQFAGYEEEINEEDEKLMEAFLSKDAGQQKTLADLIVQRIKEKDSSVASEMRPVPKLDKSIIDIYKGVGTHLSKYTIGKIPKAFKHIPSMQLWEEVLYTTEPENWSPNALYQATRIFASNFGAKKAERFYKLVLLPRVREDIRKNKRLHFALYQTLKKALYKPAAFFKGILFPLCESRTCTLREAVIVGSIIEKVSIPPLHSSVALLKLSRMEYCGTTSYFIKLLLEKKYALPYRVVDAVVAHFMRFLNETRIMPVIWHQSLLAFVQRYKNELQKEDKDGLRDLLEKQKHKLVTPEIHRELEHSRNRGEKEEDLMSISSPVFVINKTIEEDRFDIPDVPMEED